MKIVIETMSHPGGGSITYLDQMLRHFAGHNQHEYTVIVPAGRNLLTEPNADNITFAYSSFPVGNVALREVYRQFILPLLLIRSSPAVLFSTGDITTMLAPVSTVVMVHNLAPYAHSFGLKVGAWRRVRNAIHRTMTWFSVRRAARVIWVSQFMAEKIGGRFGVSDEKSTVIHHGVERARFADPATPDDPKLREIVDRHEPYLLTVSTVHPHKNYEVLLEGVARLPAKYQNGFDLLIVGRQPDEDHLEKLRSTVKEKGLVDSVRFLGGVSHEAVPYMYARASLYLLPSKIESFGMTPLEAMAAGIPVVAADATAIPEVCGDAAEYFNPDDPTDLADTITRVLGNPELRRNLVAAGERRVADFDWEKTAAKTEALLRRAAEEE